MARTVIEHRRELHSRAETGFELPKTREYINRCLRESGYVPETIGSGSIIAVKKGEVDSYVMLRADMDALKMQEQTELPFSSRNGNMHSCGHDMHSAMLLSAAEQLSGLNTRCGIIYLFQAAEETLCGAKDVIDTGLLSRLNVICAISIHVLTAIEIPVGTVIIPPDGVAAPGADVIRIEIRGKSAHGSTQHLGRSSIPAAINIIQSINHALNNELSPSEPRLLNWGKINGGLAANTVAEQTVIEGNFRYKSPEERNRFISRISKICKACEEATECQVVTKLIGGCPPLENDAALIDLLKSELSKELPNLLTADSLGTERSTLGGSEDFAHFCRVIPAVMLSIAAGRPSDGYCETLHRPKTDFDERSLEIGVLTFLSGLRAIEKSLPQ